jgi:hypothetical protein
VQFILPIVNQAQETWSDDERELVAKVVGTLWGMEPGNPWHLDALIAEHLVQLLAELAAEPSLMFTGKEGSGVSFRLDRLTGAKEMDEMLAVPPSAARWLETLADDLKAQPEPLPTFTSAGIH